MVKRYNRLTFSKRLELHEAVKPFVGPDNVMAISFDSLVNEVKRKVRFDVTDRNVETIVKVIGAKFPGSPRADSNQRYIWNTKTMTDAILDLYRRLGERAPEDLQILHQRVNAKHATFKASAPSSAPPAQQTMFKKNGVH